MHFPISAGVLMFISYASSIPTFNEIGCQSNEICVDLNTNNGITNLGNGVSVLSSLTGLYNNPCSRQVVFKATFDTLPSNADCLCHDNNPYGGKRMLKLQMYMSDAGRSGWLWDFGDSVSNNGWAGDSGHTEYEAEAQGLGTTISVYANNVNATECKAQLLYSFPGGVSSETNKVDIWIANHFIKIKTDKGLQSSHCDKCLYGLNGQYTPGAIDQDIYVAINRVVAGNYRSGNGVCYLKMSWETANLLSKVIELNNGTLDYLSDEIFFQLVRNNVHGDSLIFGSAIAIEKGVYSKYDKFCPYAYKKNNSVHSQDISINYNYLDTKTEWYNSVKVKNWTDVTMATDDINYRKGDDSLPAVEEVYPIAELDDGHWTNPYYDCGGGDIWMVTYSSPIFRLQNGIVHFRICEKGFYSPIVTLNGPGYNGEEIETFFQRNGRIGKGMFRCAACAAGCDTCVNASPCLHQRNEPLMISLTFLNFLAVVGIVAIAIVTYIYRMEVVIKSASPIFLKLMCLGGILMCVQFFLYYPEASIIICSVRIWPLHVGFYILYGSLILKTWRISMIFSVGKQKRIRLTDQVLLQRFALLLLLIVATLSAWSASRPPKVETLKTSSNLKFYSCSFGPWEHAFMAVEIVFLLYGVYLSYTVRKAPTLFNESKLITWAVYNAIILGSFMSFMSKLLNTVLGPDLVTVFQFAQIQVYTTVTLLIIFVPKFLAIKKKLKIEPRNQASQGTKQTGVTVTGRVRSQGSTLPAVVKVYASTQTDWEC